MYGYFRKTATISFSLKMSTNKVNFLMFDGVGALWEKQKAVYSRYSIKL